MKNLYVFDIHGTVVNSEYEITPKTRKTIKDLSENNAVALASGHHWRRTELYKEKYNIPFISIGNTGSLFYDANDNSVQQLSKVSDEVKFALLEEAKKYKCFLYTHTKERSYVCPFNETYETLNKELPIPVLPEELTTIEEIDDIVKNNDITQTSIKTYSENIEAIYQKILPVAQGTHRLNKILDLFVDTGSISTSKWTGALSVAEKYNISEENIFIFGDDTNDEDMIVNCKNSVAMGNAIPDMKLKAKYVTKSHDDDGIEYFVNYIQPRTQGIEELFEGLYYITGSDVDPFNRTNLEQVKYFISLGAKVIQYREKNMSVDTMRKELKEIRQVCRENNVFFIMNDFPLLAKEFDCDGIHIGSSDNTISETREIVGHKMLLGYSPSTINDWKAIEHELHLVDMFGVGAIFDTNTKEDAKNSSSVDIDFFINKQRKPVVAIGGIKNSNLSKVKDMGFKGWCMISEVLKNGN